MSEKKLNLSPPWVEFYHEMEAMFKHDPGVKVTYDEDENAVTLFVEGAAKAEALTELLPAEKTFGNITVPIKVVPANSERSKISLFQDAFQGNSAFAYTITLDDIFTNPISYVIFKKEVVQFYNDNLGDPHGFKSTLYETLAEDIFEDHDGVCFSTDIERIGKLDKPLGEWP